MVNDDLLVFERVLAAYEFEDNQAGAGAGYLADGAHEEVAVEVLSPSTSPLGKLLALSECLFVCMVVSGHDA